MMTSVQAERISRTGFKVREQASQAVFARPLNVTTAW